MKAQVGFDDVLEGRQVLREAGEHLWVSGPTHGVAQLERGHAEFQVAGGWGLPHIPLSGPWRAVLSHRSGCGNRLVGRRCRRVLKQRRHTAVNVHCELMRARGVPRPSLLLRCEQAQLRRAACRKAMQAA